MTFNQALGSLEINTPGKGFTDITPKIKEWLQSENISCGILLITTMHTSCSLTINENADPNVLRDLESYIEAIVPEEGFKPISGNGKRSSYSHADEGLDDMPAHIKTSLTSSSISLSFKNSQPILGTWQAIYLWEHRSSRHLRKVCLHAMGS